MELFGAKFSIALGAWKLRFVLMLEDDEDSVAVAQSRAQTPHHLKERTAWHAKAQ